MEDITYLHLREKIDELSKKERNELLIKMLDNWIQLRPNEVKYLTPEQHKRYTNQEFQTKRWITPDEWKDSDETQKELFSYNSRRTTIYPELFDSMDKEWRKNILMTVNVLSGMFLQKDDFERLSNEEKKYYVNKKIIKTSSLYPFEIPYLTQENQEKIISHIVLVYKEDFTKEQLEAFSKKSQAYYKKQLKISSTLRESIRGVIRKNLDNILS